MANLFTYSGFPGTIPPSWGPDTNATLTYTRNRNAPGSAYASGSGRLVNSTDNGGMFTEVLALATSTDYHYSVDIQNNGGNTALQLLIRETTGFTSVAFTNFTIDSNHVRYELPFTSHASVSNHIFYVWGQSGTNFDLYMDAFQVETGTAFTTYQETPTPDVPYDFMVFGGPLLVDSPQTYFTSDGIFVIHRISLYNEHTSAVDFTMSIGTDAAATRIYDGLSIPADTQRNLRVYLPINYNESIQAFASVSNVLTCHIDGKKLC